MDDIRDASESMFGPSSDEDGGSGIVVPRPSIDALGDLQDIPVTSSPATDDDQPLPRPSIDALGDLHDIPVTSSDSDADLDGPSLAIAPFTGDTSQPSCILDHAVL